MTKAKSTRKINWDNVLQDLKQGLSVREAAEKHGITPQAIYKRTRASRQKDRSGIRDEDRAKIKAMLDKALKNYERLLSLAESWINRLETEPVDFSSKEMAEIFKNVVNAQARAEQGIRNIVFNTMPLMDMKIQKTKIRKARNPVKRLYQSIDFLESSMNVFQRQLTLLMEAETNPVVDKMISDRIAKMIRLFREYRSTIERLYKLLENQYYNMAVDLYTRVVIRTLMKLEKRHNLKIRQEFISELKNEAARLGTNPDLMDMVLKTPIL